MFSVAVLLLLLAAGSCVKCETLTQPESVTVQPGQRLSITCQVSYSVSTYATAWIRQPEGQGLEWIGRRYTGNSYYKDSLKNKFSIELDTSNKRVTLNGQNVQPEDSAVYYCARESHDYFDYWGKGTTVTVTSATSTGPTVFPLIQCGSENAAMVTLGCLATGFTPSSLTFSWTKNDAALTDFIQYPAVLKNNAYTGVSQIQVKREDWNPSQTFKCVATHPAGNGQAVVAPPKPVYQLPALKVCSSSDEEGEVSFSCLAKDFSPKSYELKWLKNGHEVTLKNDEITAPLGERKDGNGTTLYSASSFLTVPDKEWTFGATYTCLFKGKGENNTPTYKNASVIYKGDDCLTGDCRMADAEINILDPTVEDMLVSRKGTITCQVTINKGAISRIFWQDENGAEMADAFLIPTRGKKTKYELGVDITYDEWTAAKRRYCVVESDDWFEPLKKTYVRNTGGQTQRPSVFMLPPVEHTRKERVTLTCYVKDFFPKDVFVSWLVDDEEANSEYEFNTTNSVQCNGSNSAYGQLSLSLEQWNKPDVVYSCVVYHESLGNTTKTIVRSIGYRTGDKTNLVNLSMNVPDSCKAQ